MRIELSNNFVKIRRYCADDIPLLFEAARESVNEMFPWTVWCHPDYTLEESQSFVLLSETAWEQKTGFNFAVFDQSSNLFLGGVGFSRIDRKNNFANLGYWVRSSQTKRGVATAAALLAAKFGFEDLGLNRIEILMAIENVASRRVAEKAGAKREGILRNRLLLHNRPHDALIYSLIQPIKPIKKEE
ncbi:MAG: GNAT family N-acetyltransferase [Acidobacteriota bacterium]|nr:GNAT family N-acetyltransferase [Acidobacteriota bacterium]